MALCIWQNTTGRAGKNLSRIDFKRTRNRRRIGLSHATQTPNRCGMRRAHIICLSVLVGVHIQYACCGCAATRRSHSWNSSCACRDRSTSARDGYESKRVCAVSVPRRDTPGGGKKQQSLASAKSGLRQRQGEFRLQHIIRYHRSSGGCLDIRSSRENQLGSGGIEPAGHRWSRLFPGPAEQHIRAGF